MAPVIILPGNNTVRSIGSHVWMALGLLAGLALGLAAVWTRSPVLLAATQALRPLGTLFLNLLSMVVIPLVATALFAGVAGLGDLRRVGRLGIAGPDPARALGAAARPDRNFRDRGQRAVSVRRQVHRRSHPSGGCVHRRGDRGARRTHRARAPPGRRAGRAARAGALSAGDPRLLAHGVVDPFVARHASRHARGR